MWENNLQSLRRIENYGELKNAKCVPLVKAFALDDSKIGEARSALFIIQNTSIIIIDQLTELCKHTFECEYLKMYRIKCGN